MEKKLKTKKVPATTNNITTGIINLLLKDGHSASRVNVQASFDQVGVITWPQYLVKAIQIVRAAGYVIGRWRKSGARVGVADIVCCMYPSGSFLSIEIKNEATNDKMSKEQNEYSEEIRKAGGDYWIVISYAQFLELYNRSRWNYQTIR